MTINPSTKAFSLTAEFRGNNPPPKQESKASPRLSFRLSEDELAELRARAGKRTISAYVRQHLFGEGHIHRRSPQAYAVGNSRALAQVLALLGKSEILGNLNTLAAEARAGSLLLDEQAIGQIEEACRIVSRMRDELVSALDLREGRNR